MNLGIPLQETKSGMVFLGVMRHFSFPLSHQGNWLWVKNRRNNSHGLVPKRRLIPKCGFQTLGFPFHPRHWPGALLLARRSAGGPAAPPRHLSGSDARGARGAFVSEGAKGRVQRGRCPKMGVYLFEVVGFKWKTRGKQPFWGDP